MTRPLYLVDPHTMAFRMKVQWYVDILQHRPARQYLWCHQEVGLGPGPVLVGALRQHWERHQEEEKRLAVLYGQLAESEGAVARPQFEYSIDTASVARYMAGLHYRSLRRLTDHCALIMAADSVDRGDVADRLESILADDLFAASYTHQAVRRQTRDPRTVFEVYRSGEQTAYAEALKRQLADLEALGTVPATATGRVRWALLKGLERPGLAFPILPVFDRLPGRIVPPTTLRARPHTSSQPS